MDDMTQKIYVLVKRKMREQGAYDLDAYGEFVDEAIEYYQEKGLLEDDDNLEFIKDQVMAMHDSASENLSDED